MRFARPLQKLLLARQPQNLSSRSEAKMSKHITRPSCVLLVLLTITITGCGGGDEPVIIGGPTQEILDWQAKNRAEFEATAKAEHGN